MWQCGMVNIEVPTASCVHAERMSADADDPVHASVNAATDPKAAAPVAALPPDDAEDWNMSEDDEKPAAATAKVTASVDDAAPATADAPANGNAQGAGAGPGGPAAGQHAAQSSEQTQAEADKLVCALPRLLSHCCSLALAWVASTYLQ